MFPKNPYINQQIIVDGVNYTYTPFGWRFTSSLATTSKEEVDGESVEIVSGKDGKDGKDGTDGITPKINSSGAWQIGDTITGVQAQGPRGYSMQYQWSGTQLGIKTEEEPVYSYVDLKGPQGPVGPKGAKGDPGDVTNAVSELERTNWNAAYAWGDHSDQGYLTTTPDYSEVYHPFSGLSTLDFKSKALRSKTLVLPTITPSDLDALEAGIYLGDSGFDGTTPGGGETYTLPQASSAILGGIKADPKTTESTPVVIDTNGFLFVPESTGGSGGDLQQVTTNGATTTIKSTFVGGIVVKSILQIPNTPPTIIDAGFGAIYLGESGFTGELPIAFNPNLGDLADINFSSLADNDTLVYNLATQKFINAPLPSGSGAVNWNDITNKPSSFAPSTHTHSEYLTAVTKLMVENVLTGDISSHNHNTVYHTKNEIANLISALEFHPLYGLLDGVAQNLSANILKSNTFIIPTSANGLLENEHALFIGDSGFTGELPEYLNINQVADLPEILLTKADLVDGKILASQLPTILGGLELGDTEFTAYRGDRGKVAYDHSQVAHAPVGAQKNSDITKAEIEGKLIGVIVSHSHTVTKTDVGLDNVDNLQQATKVEFDAHNADAVKHITALERTAWNAKGSSNLTLGITSGTAYRGDYGNIAHTHSQSEHAPSNAQKNSDITKVEIEAKLTGTITSHTHTFASLTSRPTTLAGYQISDAYTKVEVDRLAKYIVGYNFSNGFLVKTDVARSENSMLVLHIKGNSYGGGVPINTLVQVYNYVTSDAIINTGAVNNGYKINEVKAFYYNNLVYFWVPQQASLMTMTFQLLEKEGQVNRVASVSNSAVPTTGVEKMVTITPRTAWFENTLTNLSQLTDNIGVASHIANGSNPHSVTKLQVGLGNVTNESKETMFANSAFTGTTTANKIKSNIITIPSAAPSSTVDGEWYFYIT